MSRGRVMSSRYNATFMLSDAELGTLSFVNVAFSIAGAFGNMFVCLALLYNKNLHNTTNIFIFSLACSDLVVCFVAQPMFVVSLIQSYQQENTANVFEDVRKRLTWISMLASAGNLLGVTLDRYVAISDPLRYQAKMTKRRCCVFVALIWVIALVLGTETGANSRSKMVAQIYVFFLFVCLIFPTYCHVLWIARKHARVIHNAVSHLTYEKDRGVVQRRRPSSAVRKADKNSLKTVGIITSIFVFGWFPILILPFLYRAGAFNPETSLEAFQWVNTLALCSSACNPVVYSWRDRRFRRAMTTIYARWSAKKVVPIKQCIRTRNRSSTISY